MPGYFWRIKDFLASKKLHANNLIAARNGCVYEIKDNIIGRIIVKRDYLPQLDELGEAFSFNLPKIPAWVLSQTMAFFQEHCNVEVMVKLYYDKYEKRYLLACIPQYVSKVSIRVKDIVSYDTARFCEVMDIHSHNKMAEFFSDVDDKDEVQYRLYGVIGRVNTRPELKLRVGAAGRFINLEPTQIFEDFSLGTDGYYPKEWDSCIFRIVN